MIKEECLTKITAFCHSQGLQNTITVSAVKNTEPVQSLNQDTPFKQDTADSPRRVSPPQPSRSDGSVISVTGRRLSRVSLGAEQYPETVEALMEVGRLRDRHESLEARVEQLEANKADKSQLQHLSDLLSAMGTTHIDQQHLTCITIRKKTSMI